MSDIIDSVQGAIGDLRGFQTENRQVERWHTESLDTGQEVVRELDQAENTSEGLTAKAAEFEGRTGDVVSSIDNLITQVSGTLGMVVLAETSVKESRQLRERIKDDLEKVPAHHEAFTDSLGGAIVASGGTQQRVESALERLVDIGMEQSSQSGGAGTSMLSETRALSELTEAYVNELTQAAGGLGRNAVHVLDSARNALGGIKLGTARRDGQHITIGTIRHTLESVLDTLQQSREDLLLIQSRTSEEKEQISQGQEGIKAVREKTANVVNVLDAQKEVPSTSAQVADSAIESGGRYIVRLRKR